MADVYEQNLPQKTNLTTNDYVRVVGSDDVSYKQPLSDVAQKTIENYAGSTLAGSTQSVKGAIDGLKSSATADKAELNASINEVASDLASESSTRASQDTNLQAQINQLVAPTGTAPNPAEIENARIGADNVTYTTLGDAIRTQVSDLKSENNYQKELLETLFPYNQIDYGTITDNHFVGATHGNLTESIYFSATDYIDVSNIETFVLVRGMAQFAYYNANKEYVSGVAMDTLATATQYTVPSGAVYARFSIDKGANSSGVYFCTLSNLVPLSDVDDLLTTKRKTIRNWNGLKSLLSIVSANQIVRSTITDNKAVGATHGELWDNSDFSATDYIDLTDITTFVVTNGIAQFAYYDANKNYLSGEAIATVTKPTQFAVPSGAVYARFSIDKYYADGGVYFMNLSEYYGYYTDKDNIDKIGKIIPIDRIVRETITDNYFVGATHGNLTASEYFSATDFINLTGVDTFVLARGMAQFAYYNFKKEYISGVTTDTLSTATQYTVPSGAVYARFSIDKGANSSGVYFMTLSEYRAFYKNPTIVIGTGEEYTTLKDGIAEAVKWANAKVIVKKGTYDIIEEFGASYFENFGTNVDGIILGNGVDITFEQGALVTCHYTGSNINVITQFSPFLFHGEWERPTGFAEVDGFAIHGLRFEGSNTRYVVHDEAGGKGVPYKNIYDHCEFTFDGTINIYPQIIGGGLGQSGEIIIKDCIFNTTPYTDWETAFPAVSYHNNNSGSDTDLSSIVVSGCAFMGRLNTLRLGYIGASPRVTKCLAHSNLFRAEPFVFAENETSTHVNMELIAYANEIRQTN